MLIYGYYATFGSSRGRSYAYGFFYTVVLASFAVAGLVGSVMSYESLDDGSPGQILVLNPQSHPVVGGHWIVEFTTTGNHDLVVSAVNGTAFGDDLVFAELYGSDGTVFTPSDVQNSTMTFENFADSNGRGGSFKVQVYTPGEHHLRFEFGDSVAYASNDATVTRVTTGNTDGTYTAGDSILIYVDLTEPVTLDLSAAILESGRRTFESVTTMTIDGKIYALAVDSAAREIQIINITLPAKPSAVGSISYSASGISIDSPSVTGTTIDGLPYALLAVGDRLNIVNMTDPQSPTLIASAIDAAMDSQGEEYSFDGATSVAVEVIDGRTYALIAVSELGAIQILDITDPSSPLVVAFIEDGSSVSGGTYTTLAQPSYVTTAVIGGHTYALAASLMDDGIQIINVTDPSNHAPVATALNSQPGFFLDDPRSIAAATIGSSTYALVANGGDGGVQIIDITNPANPGAVDFIRSHAERC